MDLVSSSLAQLQLDSQPHGGAISRLPNELVQSILSRVDMQELISMKVVCKKWQAVICSIGNTKKSLSLAKCDNSIYDVDFIKKRSFGQIDLNTFTTIKVKSFRNEHLSSQLVNLFPNIESIAMDLSLSDIFSILPRLDQLTTLSFTFGGFSPSNEHVKLLGLINSCVSLKRLDIRVIIYLHLMSILAPTLARLEQFSYSGYESSLVDHFGPNCSRVSLNIYHEKDLTQWHTINGQWLANVTHLDLKEVRELGLLIEYLSKHAAALQVLHLQGRNYTLFNSHKIANLSKLKHLSEIELSVCISVDLPQLEEAVRNFELIPLASIRTFTLYDYIGLKDSNQLTSIFCTILPNVEHLNLKSNFKLETFEQYLDRFTNCVHTL